MNTLLTIYLCSVVVAFFMAIYMTYVDWSRGCNITFTSLIMVVCGTGVSPIVVYAFLANYSDKLVIFKGKKL